MKLLIAEKPNAALEIAKALGINTESRDGFIEGGDYVITWCFGHLVTLKSPDDYDPKFKKWKFDDLPILPEKYELKVIEGKEAQFKIVKDLLNGKIKSKKINFEYVINATDAGREGE
ncbi:MAG: DNA topoisomerase III, partial [Silvanigrellaceae bacterium]|nr:DNA topoisomerase III [Silvanigrellaceae bacterium]